MPIHVSDWETDSELGPGFEQRTLHFDPDYDGEVTATLVRSVPLLAGARGAILYLHGFIDYFFHSHVADAFRTRSYNFYALDLRKYGRSWRDPHPNFCKDISEYFEEMTAALAIISSEGGARVIVLAHSTGALPAVLYAKEGPDRDRISRLVLNSPFLDFREPRWKTRSAAAIGRIFPFVPRRDPVSPWYGQSLHKSARGEWDFNTRLKPLSGFIAYLGWVAAIVNAHDRAAAGLGLTQPVLVLHSDRSCDGGEWKEEFHRADLVLDVEDIKRLSPGLGPRVDMREVEGAKHDVLLSQPEVRARAFAAIFDWLA